MLTSLMLICLKRCILISCHTRPSTSQHFLCSDLVVIMMAMLIMMMWVMLVMVVMMLKYEVKPDVV